MHPSALQMRVVGAEFNEDQTQLLVGGRGPVTGKVVASNIHVRYVKCLSLGVVLVSLHGVRLKKLTRIETRGPQILQTSLGQTYKACSIWWFGRE